MKKALTIVTAALLLGGGAYYAYTRGGTDAQPAALKDYSSPVLAEEYRNETYGFTLQVPEGFAVQELVQGESDVVVLQDAQGEGIQLMMTPFDEDLRHLTEARVRADIPDMALTDVQPVTIGPEHTGLAFKSDNEAFGGASREVWFVFEGTLYQISTYARLDPLLVAIFSTWNFE